MERKNEEGQKTGMGTWQCDTLSNWQREQTRRLLRLVSWSCRTYKKETVEWKQNDLIHEQR